MSELYQWNLTDNSNVDPLKSGYAEGAARSNANNRVREVMGALRRWYAAPEWLHLYRDANGDALVVSKISATVYRVLGADVTAISVANRRVRFTPGGTTARIVSSVFAAGNTDVTITDGVVPNALTEVELFHSTALGLLAFSNTLSTGFFVPPTPDSVGLQAAIDAASAAGGGIVLLDQPAYAIDAAAINVASDVVVFGTGPSATVCTVNGALDAEPFVMQSRTALVGLTINAAAQAFAGTRDLVRIAANAQEVVLESLRLESPNRDGIALLDSAQKVRIAGVTIVTPGRDGIRIADPDGDAKEITLADVVVSDPGRLVNGARGVLLAGRVQASNLHVELTRAAPKAQVGIELATKDASGLTHAHTAGVHGFTIQGAGEDATGLWVGGRGCVAADGSIALPGNTSRGIRIESTGAGQVADHNLVSNVVVEGADLSVLVQASAYDNQLVGLRVFASQTTDVEDRGRRNEHAGCVYNGSLGAGAVVFASSEDAAFRACTFRNVIGTAVDFQVGALRPQLHGCILEGNGAQVVDASVTSRIYGCPSVLNTVTPLGGSLFGGTASTAYQLGREQKRCNYHMLTNDFGSAFGTPARQDPVMERLVFQSPENTSRLFRVDWIVRTVVTGFGAVNSVSLHMGPLGTVADPVIGVARASNVAQIDVLKPNAGDKISIDINWQIAGGVGTVVVSGGVGTDRLMRNCFVRTEPMDEAA